MTNRERIETVLAGGKPDRTPFLPFSELIPRGSFELSLRRRGMGFIRHAGSVWSELPHVEVCSRSEGGIARSTYVTSAGELSTAFKTHAGPLSNDASVQTEWMIKNESDYPAAIALIDDAVFNRDPDTSTRADIELGDDGILHTWAVEPPYMDAQYFLGLEAWSWHQVDHPAEFRSLLQALERRAGRNLSAQLECQDRLVNLGNLAGNFGPHAYRELVLPFYRKYVPLFKERGIKTTLHADALNLRQFVDIIPETGVDVVEAFTPPPVGDLPLEEARKAWGEKTTIWINFPETVFHYGYEAIKRYTIDLLRSDPSPNKFLGMTEMGLLGAQGKNERIFRQGFEAIMDALDVGGTDE
jgi:hypothetical protein